jgi:hypothetical protein
LSTPCRVVQFRLGRGDIVDLTVEIKVAQSIHLGEDAPRLFRMELPAVMPLGA